MVWEYRSVVSTATRPGQNDVEWSTYVFAADLESTVLHRETTAVSRGLYWCKLLGLLGWELCNVRVERVTFPGGALDLKDGNKHALPYRYTYTLKRPVNRQLTQEELAALRSANLL